MRTSALASHSCHFMQTSLWLTVQVTETVGNVSEADDAEHEFVLSCRAHTAWYHHNTRGYSLKNSRWRQIHLLQQFRDQAEQTQEEEEAWRCSQPVREGKQEEVKGQSRTKPDRVSSSSTQGRSAWAGGDSPGLDKDRPFKGHLWHHTTELLDEGRAQPHWEPRDTSLVCLWFKTCDWWFFHYHLPHITVNLV